jgi:hypothetical protein
MDRFFFTPSCVYSFFLYLLDWVIVADFNLLHFCNCFLYFISDYKSTEEAIERLIFLFIKAGFFMKILKGLISLFLFCACLMRAEDKSIVVSKKETKKSSSIEIKKQEVGYSSYFKEAHLFAKTNNYNQDFFFLIDLGKHSGYKRFFVYDFKKNRIAKSYMVSHGCGDAAWGGEMNKENAPISNVADSHCSSVGKYMISNRGVSQWGIKVNYLLMGKDKTNSNALSRAIVLHSWNAIPDDEIYPNGTPEGWGCPAVSNKSMKEIDEMLKVNKRVLMWIIKSS